MTAAVQLSSPEALTISLKVLDHGKDLPIPHYATEESAGVDLYAAIDSDITLTPFERRLIPTGLQMALPKGYEAQIRPRSGLALKNGLSVLNTPGTIDSDYRGEVGIILINLSQKDFTVSRGMRIAQMIIAPVVQADFFVTDNLNDTSRGSGGFGHTGS